MPHRMHVLHVDGDHSLAGSAWLHFFDLGYMILLHDGLPVAKSAVLISV